MKVGPETKLVASIFNPSLERLPLDCSNCRGRQFAAVVSPLPNEEDVAAVLQALMCVRCGKRFKIHDGVIGGKRSDPVR